MGCAEKSLEDVLHESKAGYILGCCHKEQISSLPLLSPNEARFHCAPLNSACQSKACLLLIGEAVPMFACEFCLTGFSSSA